MNEYEAALDDVMGEDWEQTAYEEGMQNAVEDTSRQAARFDQHFGDDSARSIRRHRRGGKPSISRASIAAALLPTFRG